MHGYKMTKGESWFCAFFVAILALFVFHGEFLAKKTIIPDDPWPTYSDIVDSGDYCNPSFPAYNKPWLDEGTTPCDWAGYVCDSREDCDRCNMMVERCQL